MKVFLPFTFSGPVNQVKKKLGYVVRIEQKSKMAFIVDRTFK